MLFVHLWGVESGTGKTVALMLAASVWGNPAIGQYVQTFNATQVGHEKQRHFKQYTDVYRRAAIVQGQSRQK